MSPRLHSFSIIIPTYNRASSLRNTLNLLSKLKYPASKFEVIIVNNNSNDDTKKVIETFIQTHSRLHIRYYFERQQGRTFASHTGIKHATYSKIVFIDDDVQVNPQLLAIYSGLYREYPHAAVIGGKIDAEIIDTYNPFLRKLNLQRESWVLGSVDYGPHTKTLSYPNSLLAGNMSLNLEELGEVIFSPLLGRKAGNIYLYAEDYELCLRCHLQGKQVVYSPLLLSSNTVESERLSTRYFRKRYYGAGIENYIIDHILLSKCTGHVPYAAVIITRLRNSPKYLLKRLIRLEFSGLLFDTLNEASFALGYLQAHRYVPQDNKASKTNEA